MMNRACHWLFNDDGQAQGSDMEHTCRAATIPHFDLIEPLEGFDPVLADVEGPRVPDELGPTERRGGVDGTPAGPHMAAASRCTVRRTAGKPYLQCHLKFPAAIGELVVYCGDRLVDRADLMDGWQHSAVELKSVPTPAELTLVFRDAAGAPVDGVLVRSISLSDSWGRGQRKRLKCYLPFTLTAIFQDFSVYPCCCRQWLNGNQIAGDTKTQRLDEIWNGSQYQRMRSLFLEGKYGETCREEVCPFLTGEAKFMSAETNSREPQPEVIRAVNEGHTVVEHGPIFVHHDIDRGCNLECVMCRDAKVLPNDDNVEHALRDVHSALELGSLEQLWLSGAGEPFAMKKVVQLLETDTLSRKGVALAFNTNLTYFNDKLWRRIGHNKFANITVSADGCSPEVYDAVRVGSSWKIVAENMRFLSTLRRQDKIDHVTWNYTILRQNIPDVGSAIRFAEEMGFDTIRFIAQLGALSRTNGNMFEDYDIEALDALYAELERADAFANPRVAMSEIGMRNRRYLAAEYRLELARHLFERRSYIADKSAPLPHGDWRQCARLVQTIMDDIEGRTIRWPETLPESLMQFLLSFAEYTEQHYCSPAGWAGIAQDPIRSPASAAAHAQRLACWSRDLMRGVRHDAVPGAA
jgi:MoaA/NifB/PqqE/SkfB family radical SAM enzyme